MRIRRLLASLLVVLVAAPAVGCFLWLPTRGTPVWVDRLAGDFWSGAGMLTEISPDGTRCKVYARGTALVVEGHWVSCSRVHPRALN